MPVKHPVYDSAVAVSKEYLGPAGERFMRRQIETHLGIAPEQLRPENIPELIDWVKPAFAILTNNKKHLEAFASDLASVSEIYNSSHHGKDS